MATLTVIHDETYYFEDGSCVLKVENYLFNLHRSILRRHSGFFHDMFAIPQETLDDRGSVEGSSDEHPIVCNDTVGAFRAWCWVLYAGFNELEIAKQGHNFYEEQYTHIAALSHKYACDAIEKWARELLDAKLDQAASSPSSIKKRTLKYIVRTSMKCGWLSTQKASEKLLLDFTGGTAADLSEMLKFADSLSNPQQVKARAYYAFLDSIDWQLCPAAATSGRGLNLASEDITSQSWWDPWDALTDAGKITLYRGFHGLTCLQSQLQGLPQFNGGGICRCNRVWASNTWSIRERRARECDHYKGPKEFLMEMKNTMNGYPDCSGDDECPLVQLSKDIEEFLESLMNVWSNSSKLR